MCNCATRIIGGLTIRSIGIGETKEQALNNAFKECQKRLSSTHSVYDCSP